MKKNIVVEVGIRVGNRWIKVELFLKYVKKFIWLISDFFYVINVFLEVNIMVLRRIVEND